MNTVPARMITLAGLLEERGGFDDVAVLCMFESGVHAPQGLSIWHTCNWYRENIVPPGGDVGCGDDESEPHHVAPSSHTPACAVYSPADARTRTIPRPSTRVKPPSLQSG